MLIYGPVVVLYPSDTKRTGKLEAKLVRTSCAMPFQASRNILNFALVTSLYSPASRATSSHNRCEKVKKYEKLYD